jgi:hypothetical protein
MLSFLVWPKVITLSGFYCNSTFFTFAPTKAIIIVDPFTSVQFHANIRIIKLPRGRREVRGRRVSVLGPAKVYVLQRHLRVSLQQCGRAVRLPEHLSEFTERGQRSGLL